MACFPPADTGMPPGGSKGTKARLLLPQAWANTGGEQMYRREKRSTELRRDQRGEKKRNRNQQTMGGGGKPVDWGRKERNRINTGLWQLCDDRHWDERTDTRPSNSCELNVYKGWFLSRTPTLQDLNSGREKTTDSVSAQPARDIL